MLDILVIRLTARHRLLIALLAFGVLVACHKQDKLAPTVFPPATPEPTDGFDYPMDPSRYGPYVRGVTGLFNVDTRFDVQNPGVGHAGKCFRDQDDEQVPFSQLYHAGVDWFGLSPDGSVDGQAAAGDNVYAVANGVVYFAQDGGQQGHILVIEHWLPDGSKIWSAYWHMSHLRVGIGQSVSRGQAIGVVHNQGGNSHLHWEMRNFADGSNLFALDSAGGRGTCNGKVAGVGYTWDDDAQRARPTLWGYLDPTAFIEEHLP